RLATVIRLPLEVGLFATESVAKGGCRGRPCPARIFPLRFGGQPHLAIAREIAGLPRECRKPLAKRFSLGEGDVADWHAVALGQFHRERARQLADDAFPIPLRGLVLRHPESSGQRDYHLIFAGASFRFAPRTPHHESARW